MTRTEGIEGKGQSASTERLGRGRLYLNDQHRDIDGF